MSTKSPAFCILLCGATLLPACQGTLGPQGDDDQAPIVNGTVDTGDPAVVAILSFDALPDAQGRFSGSICTGEVIAPRLVLTAAHCVSKTAVFTEVHTRGNVAGVQPGQGIQVLSRTPHPLYNANDLSKGHDVAVFKLLRPINVTPLDINRASSAGLAGQSARVIGYGAARFDEKGIVGVGVKRQATAKIESVGPLTIKFASVVYGGTVGQQCAGDSGGPALVNIGGVERIVGISSYSTFDNLSQHCTTGGYDTRIDAVADFVDSFLKGAGGPQAPQPPAPPAGGGQPGGLCDSGNVQVSSSSTGGACTARVAGAPGAACAGPQDCSEVCTTCGGVELAVAACVDNRCVDAATTLACAAQELPLCQ
jgi:secreted trypsin-like serine protease